MIQDLSIPQEKPEVILCAISRFGNINNYLEKKKKKGHVFYDRETQCRF